MALNVLDSVKDYYKLVKSDLTRNGVVLKQVILECISGPAVREANQLSQLSEVFCARKKTVYEMSKMRLLMEENQKLVPLVQRLARKSPEGDKIITNEWKLKCVEFCYVYPRPFWGIYDFSGRINPPKAAGDSFCQKNCKYPKMA